MNEHIKTGKEIWSKIQSPCCMDKDRNEKWVSLDWLKEQLEFMISKMRGDNPYSEVLSDVLDMLEKDKVKVKCKS